MEDESFISSNIDFEEHFHKKKPFKTSIISNAIDKLNSFSINMKYKLAKNQAKRNFIKLYERNIKGDKMAITDFERVRTIGRGTFGDVELAKSKETGELHAIKITSKKVAMSLIDNYRREKRISMSIDHPFIAKMNQHFMDANNLYFVMTYYPAGDLCTYLNECGLCDTREAKFIAAQLTLAIRFLHSLDVVHRDVKVENVLIDRDGYVRLADFGMAKRIGRSRTYTMCGSFDYMAPEIYKAFKDVANGYGLSPDWWSLGVLIYILISGNRPFEGCDTTNYNDVLTGEIKYPTSIDPILKNFLAELLTLEPNQRLGCREKGDKELMKHPFFDDIHWPALYMKQIPPTFKPEYRPLCGEIPNGEFKMEVRENFVSVPEDVFQDF